MEEEFKSPVKKKPKCIRKCSVCPNQNDRKTIFAVPKNPEIAGQWKQWTASRNVSTCGKIHLCSDHFEKEFLIGLKQIAMGFKQPDQLRLSANAIPSVSI